MDGRSSDSSFADGAGNRVKGKGKNKPRGTAGDGDKGIPGKPPKILKKKGQTDEDSSDDRLYDNNQIKVRSGANKSRQQGNKDNNSKVDPKNISKKDSQRPD